MKVDKPQDPSRVNLRLEVPEKTGRNLILAENLGLTYDGHHWVFRGAGFQVQRGDRVAVVGPNGSGKSTLLRLVLGHLTPSEGRLYVSPTRIVYLAQEMENLNPENSVLVEVTGNSAIDQAGARTLLGCLLFSRDDVFKQVKMLSAGEKVRLAIARILVSAPPVLVLDEPTNGLDLPSRERVEEALAGYPGTMLLVSHDRYLLRRVATRVLFLESGRLEHFPGAYEAYLERDARGNGVKERQLVLETRLAQLAAALATAPAGEAERLNGEFIQISRELRQLR